MHGRRTLALALAAAGLTTVIAGPATATPAPRTVTSAVVTATNAVRAQHNLPPLRVVRTLDKAAVRHSRFLANSGRFQHEDANGRPFWNRIVKAGYPRNSTMAENIAITSAGCGRKAAAQAMELWMGSAPHRANILNRKLRAIGVGAIVANGCSGVYFTVDFGSAVTR